MRDKVVHDMHESMLRRIEALARERQWSTNDVILHALQHGLRMASGESRIEADVASHRTIEGWGHGEAAAFDDAVRALAAVQLGRRVSDVK